MNSKTNGAKTMNTTFRVIRRSASRALVSYQGEAFVADRANNGLSGPDGWCNLRPPTSSEVENIVGCDEAEAELFIKEASSP